MTIERQRTPAGRAPRKQVSKVKEAKAAGMAKHPASLDKPVASAPETDRETQRVKVLRVIAETGSATKAALEAGISRATLYNWITADADFAAAYDDAVEQGTDRLEDEVERRAVQGTKRPVYQAGKLVGHVKEYSDSLILAYLAKRREAWRVNKGKIELTGAGGGPIQVQAVRDRVADKLASMAAGAPQIQAPE